MRFRRLFSWVFVLVMLAVGVEAQAAAQIEGGWEISNASVILNDYNGLLVVKDYSTDLYTLMTPDAAAVTSEPYVEMHSEKTMFVVALEEGMNKKGLIDSSGRLVLPMQYEEIKVVSERWQLGAVYAERKGLFKSEYIFDHYDAYYQGNLVGELKDVDVMGIRAFGPYLCCYGGNRGFTFYDSNLKPSSYTPSGNAENEYDVTRNGTFHMCSGQQVGVPGCTLTTDEVESNIVVVGNGIFDLQGNQYGTFARDYDSVRAFVNGYAEVSIGGKVGLIDYTGREIIPCEYDEFPTYDDWFEHGYVIAIKDGKVGYLNRNGEETCEFKYSADEVINYNWIPMIWKYNDDETITVLSAAAGELPGRYEKVELERSDNGCPMFIAQVSEGKVGVFDMYGEVVIPADGTFGNVYDFQISYDGSVIVAAYDYGHSVILRMSDAYGLQSAEEKALPVARPAAPAGQPAASAGQPAAEEGWICTCGSSNNGNFCPECGAARPEEMKCAECGFVPEAGTTPKFCAECGNAF